MNRKNRFYTTEVAARAIGFKSIDASSFTRSVRVEWRAGTRKMRGTQIKNYYQEIFVRFSLLRATWGTSRGAKNVTSLLDCTREGSRNILEQIERHVD